MFVVFEGIDRSGKSTQCQRLLAHLQSAGKGATLLRYPDRSSRLTGPIINDYLAGRVDMAPGAASLLLAANLWEVRDAIAGALRNGTTVLMDRYTWSNIAYSAARGMPRRTFETLNDGLPVPDVIFFLDADPAATAKRAEFGAERFDRLDFQQRVAQTMRELRAGCPNAVRIDASREMDQITQTILDHLQCVSPSLNQ